MKKKLIPEMLVFMFLAAACASSGVNKGQFNLYDPQSEAKLGNELLRMRCEKKGPFHNMRLR